MPRGAKARGPRAVISAGQARRMLMHGAGLLDDPGRRATRKVLYGLIERLGFVQVDTISVVARAHHHILLSRLDGYRASLLRRLLEEDRRLFEHWTHDASIIPLDWYAYWRPRFARYRRRVRENRWWRERIGPRPGAVLGHVRERIVAEGPLSSRDFEHDGERRSGAWWGWKPQKAALEYLWWTGELAVSRRERFQKCYDLAERVFPDHHDLPAPRPTEYANWLCASALARLGVATAAELAGFWGGLELARARTWVERAGRDGRAVPVRVASADGAGPRPAVAVPDWRERVEALPAAPERTRLLSPFDPVLRDRRRALRCFGFDYRFEAFVPAPKRKFGYYVLPVLEGERLVGRVDSKLHRDREELEIRGLWWEPGVRATRARRAGLEGAFDRFAGQIGAERWVMRVGWR